MNILNALKNYLDYLEIEKNRSVKTTENYKRYLESFIRFSKVKRPEEISADKVREFRLFLARTKTLDGRTIKKSTQAYYIIALRNFLKYLAKRDVAVLSADKIELPKMPSRQIEIIDESELERLMKMPRGDDLRSLRDRAILETFFSTGLRLSELCSLDRYLNLERNEITVRGKGDKLRVVFLSEAAKKALKAYLDKRSDAEEKLFVSLSKNSGKVIGPVTARAVQRMIDRYARKAGIRNRVTPHMIRHLFATDLLMNGADLRSVQELLGHSNISTTQVYTHLTNKNLREIHQAFHARRRN
ncbi:MAG: tyrosine-type recombinase/integrase [Parcubacteria group bacterium]|nr:tyrosine-type recombinase/integrase [Parcubacteria group bacterium]